MSKPKKAYKLHDYSSKDLENALEQARNGASISKTAEEYGIPKSTLHAKLTGKSPIVSKRGPDAVLTVDEENRLEKWIINKAKLGFPMHPEEVKNAVQSVLKESPRPSCFIKNEDKKETTAFCSHKCSMERISNESKGGKRRKRINKKTKGAGT
uniref:HTH psq-type domain-containing protein n=1 Tax=Bracon brevicornis TaxID=1563983 RepID=A0A6V7J7M7_9HYME